MSDNQVHAEEAVPATATPTSDQTVTKPAEQPAETATDANNEVIEAVESADSKKDECMRAQSNCLARSLTNVLSCRCPQGHR